MQSAEVILLSADTATTGPIHFPSLCALAASAAETLQRDGYRKLAADGSDDDVTTVPAGPGAATSLAQKLGAQPPAIAATHTDFVVAQGVEHLLLRMLQDAESIIAAPNSGVAAQLGIVGGSQGGLAGGAANPTVTHVMDHTAPLLSITGLAQWGQRVVALGTRDMILDAAFTRAEASERERAKESAASLTDPKDPPPMVILAPCLAPAALDGLLQCQFAQDGVSPALQLPPVTACIEVSRAADASSAQLAAAATSLFLGASVAPLQTTKGGKGQQSSPATTQAVGGAGSGEHGRRALDALTLAFPVEAGALDRTALHLVPPHRLGGAGHALGCAAAGNQGVTAKATGQISPQKGAIKGAAASAKAAPSAQGRSGGVASGGARGGGGPSVGGMSSGAHHHAHALPEGAAVVIAARLVDTLTVILKMCVYYFVDAMYSPAVVLRGGEALRSTLGATHFGNSFSSLRRAERFQALIARAALQQQLSASTAATVAPPTKGGKGHAAKIESEAADIPLPPSNPATDLLVLQAALERDRLEIVLAEAARALAAGGLQETADSIQASTTGGGKGAGQGKGTTGSSGKSSAASQAAAGGHVGPAGLYAAAAAFAQLPTTTMADAHVCALLAAVTQQLTLCHAVATAHYAVAVAAARGPGASPNVPTTAAPAGSIPSKGRGPAVPPIPTTLLPPALNLAATVPRSAPHFSVQELRALHLGAFFSQPIPQNVVSTGHKSNMPHPAATTQIPAALLAILSSLTALSELIASEASDEGVLQSLVSTSDNQLRSQRSAGQKLKAAADAHAHVATHRASTFTSLFGDTVAPLMWAARPHGPQAPPPEERPQTPSFRAGTPAALSPSAPSTRPTKRPTSATRSLGSTAVAPSVPSARYPPPPQQFVVGTIHRSAAITVYTIAVPAIPSAPAASAYVREALKEALADSLSASWLVQRLQTLQRDASVSSTGDLLDVMRVNASAAPQPGRLDAALRSLFEGTGGSGFDASANSNRRLVLGAVEASGTPSQVLTAAVRCVRAPGTAQRPTRAVYEVLDVERNNLRQLHRALANTRMRAARAADRSRTVPARLRDNVPAVEVVPPPAATTGKGGPPAARMTPAAAAKKARAGSMPPPAVLDATTVSRPIFSAAGPSSLDEGKDAATLRRADPLPRKLIAGAAVPLIVESRPELARRVVIETEALRGVFAAAEGIQQATSGKGISKKGAKKLSSRDVAKRFVGAFFDHTFGGPVSSATKRPTPTDTVASDPSGLVRENAAVVQAPVEDAIAAQKRRAATLAAIRGALETCAAEPDATARALPPAEVMRPSRCATTLVQQQQQCAGLWAGAADDSEGADRTGTVELLSLLLASSRPPPVPMTAAGGGGASQTSGSTTPIPRRGGLERQVSLQSSHATSPSLAATSSGAIPSSQIYASADSALSELINSKLTPTEQQVLLDQGALQQLVRAGFPSLTPRFSLSCHTYLDDTAGCAIPATGYLPPPEIGAQVQRLHSLFPSNVRAATAGELVNRPFLLGPGRASDAVAAVTADSTPAYTRNSRLPDTAGYFSAGITIASNACRVPAMERSGRGHTAVVLDHIAAGLDSNERKRAASWEYTAIGGFLRPPHKLLAAPTQEHHAYGSSDSPPLHASNTGDASVCPTGAVDIDPVLADGPQGPQLIPPTSVGNPNSEAPVFASRRPTTGDVRVAHGRRTLVLPYDGSVVETTMPDPEHGVGGAGPAQAQITYHRKEVTVAYHAQGTHVRAHATFHEPGALSTTRTPLVTFESTSAGGQHRDCQITIADRVVDPREHLQVTTQIADICAADGTIASGRAPTIRFCSVAGSQSDPSRLVDTPASASDVRLPVAATATKAALLQFIQSQLQTADRIGGLTAKLATLTQLNREAGLAGPTAAMGSSTAGGASGANAAASPTKKITATKGTAPGTKPAGTGAMGSSGSGAGISSSGGGALLGGSAEQRLTEMIQWRTHIHNEAEAHRQVLSSRSASALSASQQHLQHRALSSTASRTVDTSMNGVLSAGLPFYQSVALAASALPPADRTAADTGAALRPLTHVLTGYSVWLERTADPSGSLQLRRGIRTVVDTEQSRTVCPSTGSVTIRYVSGSVQQLFASGAKATMLCCPADIPVAFYTGIAVPPSARLRGLRQFCFTAKPLLPIVDADGVWRLPQTHRDDVEESADADIGTVGVPRVPHCHHAAEYEEFFARLATKGDPMPAGSVAGTGSGASGGGATAAGKAPRGGSAGASRGRRTSSPHDRAGSFPQRPPAVYDASVAPRGEMPELMSDAEPTADRTIPIGPIPIAMPLYWLLTAASGKRRARRVGAASFDHLAATKGARADDPTEQRLATLHDTLHGDLQRAFPMEDAAVPAVGVAESHDPQNLCRVETRTDGTVVAHYNAHQQLAARLSPSTVAAHNAAKSTADEALARMVAAQSSGPYASMSSVTVTIHACGTTIVSIGAPQLKVASSTTVAAPAVASNTTGGLRRSLDGARHTTKSTSAASADQRPPAHFYPLPAHIPALDGLFRFIRTHRWDINGGPVPAYPGAWPESLSLGHQSGSSGGDAGGTLSASLAFLVEHPSFPRVVLRRSTTEADAPCDAFVLYSDHSVLASERVTSRVLPASHPSSSLSRLTDSLTPSGDGALLPSHVDAASLGVMVPHFSVRYTRPCGTMLRVAKPSRVISPFSSAILAVEPAAVAVSTSSPYRQLFVPVCIQNAYSGVVPGAEVPTALTAKAKFLAMISTACALHDACPLFTLVHPGDVPGSFFRLVDRRNYVTSVRSPDGTTVVATMTRHSTEQLLLKVAPVGATAHAVSRRRQKQLQEDMARQLEEGSGLSMSAPRRSNAASSVLVPACVLEATLRSVVKAFVVKYQLLGNPQVAFFHRKREESLTAVQALRRGAGTSEASDALSVQFKSAGLHLRSYSPATNASTSVDQTNLEAGTLKAGGQSPPPSALQAVDSGATLTDREVTDTIAALQYDYVPLLYIIRKVPSPTTAGDQAAGAQRGAPGLLYTELLSPLDVAPYLRGLQAGNAASGAPHRSLGPAESRIGAPPVSFPCPIDDDTVSQTLAAFPVSGDAQLMSQSATATRTMVSGEPHLEQIQFFLARRFLHATEGPKGLAALSAAVSRPAYRDPWGYGGADSTMAVALHRPEAGICAWLPKAALPPRRLLGNTSGAQRGLQGLEHAQATVETCRRLVRYGRYTAVVRDAVAAVRLTADAQRRSMLHYTREVVATAAAQREADRAAGVDGLRAKYARQLAAIGAGADPEVVSMLAKRPATGDEDLLSVATPSPPGTANGRGHADDHQSHAADVLSFDLPARRRPEDAAADAAMEEAAEMAAVERFCSTNTIRERAVVYLNQRSHLRPCADLIRCEPFPILDFGEISVPVFRDTRYGGASRNSSASATAPPLYAYRYRMQCTCVNRENDTVLAVIRNPALKVDAPTGERTMTGPITVVEGHSMRIGPLGTASFTVELDTGNPLLHRHLHESMEAIAEAEASRVEQLLEANAAALSHTAPNGEDEEEDLVAMPTVLPKPRRYIMEVHEQLRIDAVGTVEPLVLRVSCTLVLNESLRGAIVPKPTVKICEPRY